MCCDCDCECRPLGWLLGLPFALLSLLISIVGAVIWIVGLLLSCICPCCLCVTILVEFAIELIKAPLHVMRWFTSQIPCFIGRSSVQIPGGWLLIVYAIILQSSISSDRSY